MLPEAAVELWQTLESENIENKPILVLASKIDVPSLLSEADLLQYLKVTEAQESYSSTIDMMYVNLTLQEDCQRVLDWLKEKV